jgi:hypothetical protein
MSRFFDFAHEPVEILQRAEFRRHILVPTTIDSLTIIPDGIGHAGLSGFAAKRIVSALSIRSADRVDRRKINHIKSHGFRIVDPSEAVAECRARVRLSFGRAGEKFIPSGEGGAVPIDPYWVKGFRRCGERSVGVDLHEGAKGGIVSEFVRLGGISATHCRGHFFQGFPVRRLACACGSRSNKCGAFENLALKIS